MNKRKIYKVGISLVVWEHSCFPFYHSPSPLNYVLHLCNALWICASQIFMPNIRRFCTSPSIEQLPYYLNPQCLGAHKVTVCNKASKKYDFLYYYVKMYKIINLPGLKMRLFVCGWASQCAWEVNVHASVAVITLTTFLGLYYMQSFVEPRCEEF